MNSFVESKLPGLILEQDVKILKIFGAAQIRFSLSHKKNRENETAEKLNLFLKELLQA